jgi:hypothetical protein
MEFEKLEIEFHPISFNLKALSFAHAIGYSYSISLVPLYFIFIPRMLCDRQKEKEDENLVMIRHKKLFPEEVKAIHLKAFFKCQRKD